jgi:predicted nucleic acid-binding protein
MMAKKKQQQRQNFQQAQKDPYGEKEAVTLKDQLGGDVLAKLKEAKSSLTKAAEEQEAERQAKLAFEKKQKEKNMSFEELLNQYGDAGSKF